MKTHHVPPTNTSVRQSRGRYGVWLGLSILLIAALSLIRATMAPGEQILVRTTPSAVQTTSRDALTQGVASYLNAPPTAVPMDAATQSVMNYIHSHDGDGVSPTLWSQVEVRFKSVLAYLRAHRIR
jgi:hypothetical protein